MTDALSFFVPGIPAPGGSKRYVGKSKSGRAILVDMGGQRNRNWREAVRADAINAMNGRDPFNGPISLDITFVMPRPKAHYRSGRYSDELKQPAPHWHDKAPDVTKALRSTEDAMNGIVWKDDCLVVQQRAKKIYGDKPGAAITIEPLA